MTYTTQLSAATLEAMLANAQAAVEASVSKEASLRSGLSSVVLTLQTSHAQAWQAFVNGALAGTNWEVSHSGGAMAMNITVDMTHAFVFSQEGAAAKPVDASGAVLSLLSCSLGIDNYGTGVNNNGATFSSGSYKGIVVPYQGQLQRAVILDGTDLTSNGWTMQSGVTGEAKQVFTSAGSASVAWSPAGPAPGAMSWLSTSFPSPPAATMAQMLPASYGGAGEVTVTLNLNVEGLGRGTLYLNGA